MVLFTFKTEINSTSLLDSIKKERKNGNYYQKDSFRWKDISISFLKLIWI